MPTAVPHSDRRETVMTLWFTADQHFGHANIIRFCDRPFADVAEMDELMIQRWNSVVGMRDEVWHLGDFAYRCGPNRQSEIFHQLKGRAIHLVRGNYDRKSTLNLPWTSIQHYAEIHAEGKIFIMFHYPLVAWNKSRRGSLCLHGYSHGCLPDVTGSCDVGVDAWDFKPASIEEIFARVNADKSELPPDLGPAQR